MEPDWFKKRNYKHFDAPVGGRFAGNACDIRFVERHSWLPLIHYTKRIKRYKSNEGRTVYKDRPIMYASHRDACILSKYAAELSNLLELHYRANGLNDHIIAYRKLGKSNYAFSADAYRFARANTPCVILCFDITGFFDNLDHNIIKNRLKRLLGVDELPKHWYNVFRHVTRFSKISRDSLAANPTFGPQLSSASREPLVR